MYVIGFVSLYRVVGRGAMVDFVPPVYGRLWSTAVNYFSFVGILFTRWVGVFKVERAWFYSAILWESLVYSRNVGKEKEK